MPTVEVFESVSLPHVFFTGPGPVDRARAPAPPPSVARTNKNLYLPAQGPQQSWGARFLRSRVGMNYSQRFQRYRTADFLVLDDDGPCRALLQAYLSRIRVRSHDPTDEGRALVCETAASGQEVLDRVLRRGETFAVITIDNYLGPRSPSGREVIRELRAGGYEGALVYITGTSTGLIESEGREFECHLMEVGADALLIKGSATMKSELHRMVADLVVREFAPEPGRADGGERKGEEEPPRPTDYSSS
jgi:CheY-like chemotaxis protein